MLAALLWVLLPAQPELDVDLLPTVATSTPSVSVAAPTVLIPEAPLPEPRYYGWQPAAVRGAGVLLMALSISVDKGPDRMLLATGGTLVSVGGSAALHAVHEQGNNVMLSLVGSVLSSGMLGWLAATEARGNDGQVELVLGVGAGQLLMAVLDLSWLGYEDEVGPMLSRSADGTATLGFVLAL